MCWLTKYKRYTKEHIAKRNIRTFKIVQTESDNSIRSLFFNDFEYKINEKATSIIGVELEYSGKNVLKVLSDGLYSSALYKKEIIKSFIIKHIKINKLKNKHIKLINCVIPKGSHYYLNEHGEYVSDTLIPQSLEEITY